MKRHPLASYILKLSALSMILCFATLFLMLSPIKAYISTNIPYYILMYFFATLISYAFLFYTPEKTKMKFEKAFLLTKIFKTFVYLSVFAIVLFAHIEKNAKFAFAYLLMYFCYSIFDTITTKKLLKTNK